MEILRLVLFLCGGNDVVPWQRLKKFNFLTCLDGPQLAVGKNKSKIPGKNGKKGEKKGKK